jgi:hypothetical protein
MDKELTSTLRVISTRVSGDSISSMERALKDGRMDQSMRETTTRASSKAMENSTLQILRPLTKENGTRTACKVEAFTYGTMERPTKVSLGRI